MLLCLALFLILELVSSTIPPGVTWKTNLNLGDLNMKMVSKDPLILSLGMTSDAGSKKYFLPKYTPKARQRNLIEKEIYLREKVRTKRCQGQELQLNHNRVARIDGIKQGITSRFLHQSQHQNKLNLPNLQSQGNVLGYETLQKNIQNVKAHHEQVKNDLHTKALELYRGHLTKLQQITSGSNAMNRNVLGGTRVADLNQAANQGKLINSANIPYEKFAINLKSTSNLNEHKNAAPLKNTSQHSDIITNNPNVFQQQTPASAPISLSPVTHVFPILPQTTGQIYENMGQIRQYANITFNNTERVSSAKLDRLADDEISHIDPIFDPDIHKLTPTNLPVMKAETESWPGMSSDTDFDMHLSNDSAGYSVRLAGIQGDDILINKENTPSQLKALTPGNKQPEIATPTIKQDNVPKYLQLTQENPSETSTKSVIALFATMPFKDYLHKLPIEDYENESPNSAIFEKSLEEPLKLTMNHITEEPLKNTLSGAQSNIGYFLTDKNKNHDILKSHMNYPMQSAIMAESFLPGHPVSLMKMTNAAEEPEMMQKNNLEGSTQEREELEPRKEYGSMIKALKDTLEESWQNADRQKTLKMQTSDKKNEEVGSYQSKDNNKIEQFMNLSSINSIAGHQHSNSKLSTNRQENSGDIVLANHTHNFEERIYTTVNSINTTAIEVPQLQENNKKLEVYHDGENSLVPNTGGRRESLKRAYAEEGNKFSKEDAKNTGKPENEPSQNADISKIFDVSIPIRYSSDDASEFFENKFASQSQKSNEKSSDINLHLPIEISMALDASHPNIYSSDNVSKYNENEQGSFFRSSGNNAKNSTEKNDNKPELVQPVPRGTLTTKSPLENIDKIENLKDRVDNFYVINNTRTNTMPDSLNNEEKIDLMFGDPFLANNKETDINLIVGVRHERAEKNAQQHIFKSDPQKLSEMGEIMRGHKAATKKDYFTAMSNELNESHSKEVSRNPIDTEGELFTSAPMQNVGSTIDSDTPTTQQENFLSKLVFLASESEYRAITSTTTDMPLNLPIVWDSQERMLHSDKKNLVQSKGMPDLPGKTLLEEETPIPPYGQRLKLLKEEIEQALTLNDAEFTNTDLPSSYLSEIHHVIEKHEPKGMNQRNENDPQTSSEEANITSPILVSGELLNSPQALKSANRLLADKSESRFLQQEKINTTNKQQEIMEKYQRILKDVQEKIQSKISHPRADLPQTQNKPENNMDNSMKGKSETSNAAQTGKIQDSKNVISIENRKDDATKQHQYSSQEQLPLMDQTSPWSNHQNFDIYYKDSASDESYANLGNSAEENVEEDYPEYDQEYEYSEPNPWNIFSPMQPAISAGKYNNQNLSPSNIENITDNVPFTSSSTPPEARAQNTLASSYTRQETGAIISVHQPPTEISNTDNLQLNRKQKKIQKSKTSTLNGTFLETTKADSRRELYSTQASMPKKRLKGAPIMYLPTVRQYHIQEPLYPPMYLPPNIQPFMTPEGLRYIEIQPELTFPLHGQLPLEAINAFPNLQQPQHLPSNGGGCSCTKDAARKMSKLMPVVQMPRVATEKPCACSLQAKDNKLKNRLNYRIKPVKMPFTVKSGEYDHTTDKDVSNHLGSDHDHSKSCPCQSKSSCLGKARDLKYESDEVNKYDLISKFILWLKDGTKKLEIE